MARTKTAKTQAKASPRRTTKASKAKPAEADAPIVDIQMIPLDI